MSHDKMNQLIGLIAKSVEDNEKLHTDVLCAKLARYMEAYPYDQTLGVVSTVLEKMAENNTEYIRKSDFKGLYHKLYTRNTKFAELFSKELGTTEEVSPIKTYVRDDSEFVKEYKGDEILGNALSHAFDGSIPLKGYSDFMGNAALKSVSNTLDAWNLTPNQLQIENGSDKFLVIKAGYESPKGITHFYVPVQFHNGKVVEAAVFMGNSGVKDLNHIEIKSYLTSYAGTKLVVRGSDILGLLNKSAVEDVCISDAELAVIRLNAKKASNTEFSGNQILGQEIVESVKDVLLPQAEQFSSFEKELESPHGAAYFQFGNIVNAGVSYLNRELNSFGFKNPQIVVSKNDENTIFYSVAVDHGRIGFIVPVKVINSKMMIPNVLLCNGSVSAFNENSINELRIKNASDYKAAAVASPQFANKPSELINNIRAALTEGNHDKAEDALNVLAASGDAKAYATGFNIYMEGLAGKKVVAESCCDMILKTAQSQHPICGHTNLPVHKVYQDKDGNCRPLYRKGMDETYEAATFMNAKIFG